MTQKFHKNATNLYTLDDSTIDEIREFCPKPRREEIPLRIFINAVIYILLYSVEWRTIDKKYEVECADGAIKPVRWNTIYQRYHRWVNLGIIDNIYKYLQGKVYSEDAGNGLLSLDSMSIKCAPHVCSSCDETIGISRGGRNTKHHVITGNPYFPCTEMLTAGNINDSKPGLTLIQNLKITPESLAADKAYVSNAIRKCIQDKGIEIIIPPKKNSRLPWEYDTEKYKQRAIVENYFGNLKRCKHLMSRVDKSPKMFNSFIQLFSILSYFTHKNRPPYGRWP